MGERLQGFGVRFGGEAVRRGCRGLGLELEEEAVGRSCKGKAVR